MKIPLKESFQNGNIYQVQTDLDGVHWIWNSTAGLSLTAVKHMNHKGFFCFYLQALFLFYTFKKIYFVKMSSEYNKEH